MATYRFPTHQFRSIPAPAGSSKIGVFFVRATAVPSELFKWRDVNPREVTRNSAVYKEIVKTLQDEPDRFHERNRGITLVADDFTYDDKKHEVVIELADETLHGVVDGAHTLDAVLKTQQDLRENGGGAFLFVKTITGIDADQIAEIAGGLNTSQQVDKKSIEHLLKHFEHLKEAIKGEPYAEDVAYVMNEAKPIDVREILYYLAVFDCEAYDDKKHPVALFGRKEGIVRKFADQMKGDPKTSDSFRMLISRTKDILRLRDLIEEKALNLPQIGRYKAGKGTRIRSKAHRSNQLHFLNKKVHGKIALGWIMPMLAGFRANVEWNQPKGSFSWKVPIDELVDACIEQLVLGIMEFHESENSRPEYVGRNTQAWRMCYLTVRLAISEWDTSPR